MTSCFGFGPLQPLPTFWHHLMLWKPWWPQSYALSICTHIMAAVIWEAYLVCLFCL